ncbi:MAG: hypothetical protein JNL82_15900 [Myxococcales bacterium]|nr:hypothetical protein [Myxococcales bacterium]
MLTVTVILLLLLAVGVSGWGYARYGLNGWSSAGLLLILVVLLLTDTVQLN